MKFNKKQLWILTQYILILVLLYTIFKPEIKENMSARDIITMDLVGEENKVFLNTNNLYSDWIKDGLTISFNKYIEKKDIKLNEKLKDVFDIMTLWGEDNSISLHFKQNYNGQIKDTSYDAYKVPDEKLHLLTISNNKDVNINYNCVPISNVLQNCKTYLINYEFKKDIILEGGDIIPEYIERQIPKKRNNKYIWRTIN